MIDDPRLDQLLEELLESGGSPEEVCRSCPELLPQVRTGLQRLRRLEHEVDALFPTSVPPGGDTPAALPTDELPRLRDYEVQGELGRGGVGVVYKAWHLRLNRPVALKMLLAGPYARPKELERFLREAETVAGLRHPNIVQIYDAGELDGRPYFTMEFVEGGTLAQRIAGVPQPARQSAALLARVAEAVHVAHQSGIVHRDLTPANILLTSDGTPKVADFGLAGRLEGGGLTLSGIPMGTPGYMAPEQVQGGKGAIGPPADVYALGAILYETLTGRPPFQGTGPMETLFQAAQQEPVPVARLVARVPRDLDTICLKCLEKDPAKRYATAGELAADLERFLNHRPIRARPVGRLGRGLRWVRRHPSQAAVLAGSLLLAMTLVGGGLWQVRQRAEVGRLVAQELSRMARLQEKFSWAEAVTVLERAKDRLGTSAPADLRQRLDQCRRDLELAARLDAIRLKRATVVEGRFDLAAERRFNQTQADRDYEEAFRKAGLAEIIQHDSEGVAARVMASSSRGAMLAALDDWVACAIDKGRQDRLLWVARRADPDAWRDRVRNPVTWGDRSALAELARTAPVAVQPVPFLVALGERLQDLGGDGTAFLARVQQVYPDDFWAAFTLARELQEGPNPEAAVAPYRRALELRGDTAAVYNNLGLASYARRDWEEAYDYFQKALEIDPNFAPACNNLGLVWKGKGDWTEAIHHFRDAVRLDPELAPAHYNLGEIRAYSGGLDEAIAHYWQALRIDREFALAEYMLGVALAGRGRLDEANDREQRALRVDPANAKAHRETFGHAREEGFIHYKRTLEFDPKLTLSRNNLGLTPRDAGRLNEAIGHYEKALRLDPGLLKRHASLGQAFLALGRFRDAEAASRRCLDRLPRGHELHANILAQLRRCERLIALEERLPAVLQGKDKPADASEILEFAELCGIQGQYVAAARLDANALAASPQLAEDLRTDHRYRAACAAALAGCGRGGDGASLSRAEGARWRERAREWLRAEFTLWTKTLDGGPQADRVLVRDKLTHLWADPDLDGLRDPDALDKMPPAERQECRKLWSDLDALLNRAEGLE